MSRNFLNLGLLVIVALLVTVIMWEPGKQQDIISRLSALEADDINRIHIQRDALRDVELEKQNGNWQMLAPYRVAADETRVNALLKLTSTTSYVSFNSKGRKLADYGMQPVLAQVTFNDSLFQFGNLERISKRRYVLLPDHKIRLVTDLFYYQLRTNATQFVSPRLLNDTQRIKRLLLTNHQYEQKHDGSWLMTPTTSTIPADKLNAYIDNWQRVRASRISAAGESISDEQVSIELADGNSLVFEIVRSEDETVFIRRGIGLQYHVSKQVADLLFAPPEPGTPGQK